MADGFKIGDGFVEITAQDDTPSGLARITAAIDRWITNIERRIREGFANGFDAGADAAERRIETMRLRIQRQLDAIDGRNIRIEVDMRGLAEVIAELRLLRQQINAIDDRNIRIRASVDRSLINAHSTLNSIVTTLARVGAWATSVTSLLGPLAIGIALATNYVLELGGALLTLSATLPALVAAIGLVGYAVYSMGDGVARGLAPLRAAFSATAKEISTMAFAAVRPLATEFTRVNFPAIHDALIRISGALVGIVNQVGNWLNSTRGQMMVRTITEATATAMERLAPAVARMVIAFGELVNRAGAPAIQGLGDLITWIADATTRWLDGITRQDVAAAIEHLKKVFSDIVTVVKDVAAVIGWITEHVGGITAASDALALVGLALAALTGGGIPALLAVLTLVLNHIDAIANGMASMAVTIDRVWDAAANNPWLRKIVDDLRALGGPIMDGVREAWNTVGAAVSWFAGQVEAAWPKVAPFIDRFLNDPNLRQGAKDLAAAIVTIVLAIAALAAAAVTINATVTAGLVGAFTYIVGWVHNAIDAIATFVTSTVASISGWVTSVVSWFAQLSGQIGTWLAAALATVGAWVTAVVAWFAQLPGRAVAAISALPGQVMGVITSMADQALYAIGNMVGQAIGLMVTMPIRIVSAIVSLPGQVASILTSMANTAISIVTNLVATVTSWFTQLLVRAIAAINALPGQVTSIFNNARTQATTISANLVTSVVSFLATLPGRAIAAIASLSGLIASVFNSARAQAVSIVTNLVGQVVGILAGLAGRAASAVGNLGGVLVNAGASLLRGLMDGIRSQIGPLISLLDSITGLVRAHKGPPEKDAKLLEPAGRSVIKGFMQGVDAQTPALTDQLSDLTSSIGALGSAIPAQRQAPTGTTYNFGPGSIVLDASKIKSVDDLLRMIDGLKSTARQYGARPATQGAV